MSGGIETGGSSSIALPLFTSILLVTDFSSCSEAAAPFARLLTDQYRANLSVAHVIREPAGTTDVARETAEEHMRQFTARHSLGKVSTVVEHGPVGDVLARVMTEKNIDLAIIGTHGRSGVGKLMMGSIAQHIFNVAPCPVLTVSPRARKSWGAAGTLGTIVYGIDFSEEALKALPYALSLSKMSGAELLLVNAVKSTQAEPLNDEILRRNHSRLKQLIPPAARAWCKFDTVVFAGDPADVILKAAVEHNADFIVIGAHRIEPGPLYSVQVPLSTAYQVVAHAHCPVLRVRS